jgi:hypothetical protein
MKILSTIATSLIAVALIAAPTGNRKVTDNAKSPSAETSMKLDGKAITIEYNAPSARGRAVEGGLIPNDKPWRLGADSATTITTEAPIKIGNLTVPKGAHTLYLQGGASGWTLIVNKQTGQWGTVYDQGQDLGRVPMTVKKTGSPVETLKIELKSSGAKSGTLEITWGGTTASVPVTLA